MHDNFRAAVTALQAELTAERQGIAAPLEGWRNFIRDATEGQDALRETAQAQARVHEADLAHATELEKLLGATLEALAVFEADTTRPKIQLPPELVAQLREKITTEQAALAEVEAAREATGGNVVLAPTDEP